MEEFAPIAILLAVVGLLIWRLPKIDLGHTAAYRRRRVWNWLPLGLTYSFLYMGRYNLKVAEHALEEMPNTAGHPIMGASEFAWVFAIGTGVYGFSFLLNGPLTDRYGGRLAILVGGFGASVANALMALGAWTLVARGPAWGFVADNFIAVFGTLYALNMYFQSFGAVAIVKVNAPWFHVRERGVFGAVFGVLISLGIYFAYDWGYIILEHWGLTHVFLTPAVLLAVFATIVIFSTKNTPGQAGLVDFDTGDASSGDDGPAMPAVQVFKMMLRNPIILTIACIEFCSGFLRQAIMQWYKTFAKHTDATLGLDDTYINDHWGMFLCIAGILGATVAGVISDRVFGSRRGPVACLLYGVMLVGAVVMTFTYESAIVGPLVVVMSMAIIGVHGMLSGTASMDFGGRRNAGVAVGIIDGFVYAGTAFMAIIYGQILPEERLDANGNIAGPTTDPDNWLAWPVAMIPMALIGLVLAFRVWNAKPTPKQPAKAAEAVEVPAKAA